jgi:methanogenic corrinoid protein MtbC1
MGEDLVNALADLKEEEALRITQERLNAEEDPLEILEDATRVYSGPCILRRDITKNQ